jgi:hypothetical protein
LTRSWLCAAIGLVALIASSPYGHGSVCRAQDDSYAQELIAAARSRDLAHSATWLALLHYAPTFWHPTPASLADSADFFLDASGATDPEAELEATLRSFFAGADVTVRGREHPQCVFVARYHWLQEQLTFDPARLPEQPCPKFEEWRTAIHPVSTTLIFPEAYMNNPSSMFGHTLLRFDAEEAGARRDLLAYAANFSADPGDDGALAFTVRGVFGLYQGLFNLQPYYEKVAEYADWEQRDLWEYELNLSPDEIDFLLRHLWELRGVGFDYYFFDENCSYQLLELLKVARPDVVYWQRFQLWTAPSDTVRAVVQDTGLLRGVTFRPSVATTLRHEASLLAPASLALALEIANGRAAPTDPRLDALSPDEKALVLTVAYDDVRFAFLARGVDRKVVAERARTILVELSRVPRSGELVSPAPVPSVRPDEGHRTARLAVGAGWRRSRPFVQTQIRPVFHDLLDPQGGYTAGAQIDFLQVALRIYGDDGEVRLQDFTLVDIFSLSPRDALFKPFSWRASTRVISLLVPGAGSAGIPGLEDEYAWRSDGGVGLAYELPGAALAYGFLLADVDVGSALRNAISAGAGGEVGVYFSLMDDRLRIHLSSDVLEFALGQQHTAARWGLGQRIALGPQSALRIEVAARRDYGETWVEGLAAWQWFF